MKKLFSLLLLPALLLTSVACAGKGASNKTPDSLFTERLETTDTVTNYVQLELENGGIIRLELYPDIAPKTVANFQALVSEKFYDGLIFHRVISGFMIQGGSTDGLGYEGSPNKIFGEFTSNGFINELAHTRGVISMARFGHDNNSASSQFFIMHETKTHLDGDYAAFGRVTAGMETVDWIAAQPVNGSDKPLEDITIKEIRFIPAPADSAA